MPSRPWPSACGEAPHSQRPNPADHQATQLKGAGLASGLDEATGAENPGQVAPGVALGPQDRPALAASGEVDEAGRVERQMVGQVGR